MVGVLTLLFASGCSVWIGASEVPEVTATPVDSSEPVDTSDTSDSAEVPGCPVLLGIEGPLEGEPLWGLQRLYLRFDRAVAPNDLLLQVGPADGSSPPEVIPRMPGVFEGHEVHVVQSPPDGWSRDGEQRLYMSWGEGCESTLDFSVTEAPPQAFLGLDASEVYVVLLGDGRVFPSSLPIDPSDFDTNILFQAHESWAGDQEPTFAKVAMAEEIEQHPCSPGTLRNPGSVMMGDHIIYTVKDQPLGIDGSIARIRTGSFTVRFRETGLYVDRVEFSVPVGSFPGVDLCDYTMCRPCGSGPGQCATFWVEGMVPVPVNSSVGPSAIECEDDALGVCGGFCEE